MESVVVLADRHGVDGPLCPGTLAMLKLARRLGSPVVVLCGQADAATVESLGHHGAACIRVINASEVDEFPSAARVEALVRLAEHVHPVCVLIASGHGGCEIAAAVAVRLDSGVITDVVDLRADDEGPIAVQDVLGGTHVMESTVVTGIPVFTIRTESVEALPAPVAPVVVPMEVTLAARAARVVSRLPRSATGQSDPASAAVVIAGGRGVGSPESFALVEKVAQALGGCACGSHTATRLGWCPASRRVDQIGKVVHPQLYLAIGVSGSVRHRAGMQHAKTVVAIDSDPQAPIFDVADFGVVGDLHQVVPELLAEIHRRQSTSEA